MISAEKRCQRKGIPQTYLWSVSLMEAGQQVTYWKSRKMLHSLGVKVQDIFGYTKQLHDKYMISDAELTGEEIKKHLKQAWRNLRSVQREDRAHRNRHLEDLAKHKAAEGKEKKKAI